MSDVKGLQMSSVVINENESDEPLKMLEVINATISQEESDSKSDFYQVNSQF